MRVVRLDKSHDRGSFACGDALLDEWLKRYARQSDSKGSARVFVLAEGARIIGYYSLSSHSVSLESVPTSMSKGHLRTVPAALLGRLAVDAEYQGRRIGQRLLGDAVRRVVRASESVAIAVLVVDALHDEAARFYERYGFIRWPTDELRLFARVGDLRLTFRR